MAAIHVSVTNCRKLMPLSDARALAGWKSSSGMLIAVFPIPA
jgi:hypothetical protein